MSDAPERTERQDPPSAAARYARLWEVGTADLDAFLAAETISADERAAVLRVDQRERWRVGQRVPVEDYLRRLPGEPPDPEQALDLIYNEFLVRERLGEQPDPGDYYHRFPAVADALREQISLHHAVEAAPTPTNFARWPEPPPPPLPPPLPRSFGPYRLLKVLGRGGMGTVYLAEDPRLGRQVALKIPHFELARSAEAAARFRREARAAAGVRHSGLVPLYDVGQVDGVDYLTMPYVTGESLAARLAREGPLPQAEAVRLAIRVAEAMEAVHRAGVVHRDLKPANILLDEQGEPAVTDFGLARPVGPSDARMTDSGTVLGTPAYLAPEQIGCRAEDMGPRCDIYGLGVILYEMLAGRVPFQGSAGEILVRVVAEEPPPPSRFRPDLDPRLGALCMKALQRLPERRFTSMAEFADALRRLGAGARLTPRRRWLVPGLVALVLVAALSAWLLLRPGLEPDPFRAGSRWTGHYVFTHPRNFGNGDVELAVTSRSGGAFAGTYTTRPSANREFRWEVAGTTEGRRVYWELGKPLNENARRARSPRKRATFEGTYDGEEIRVQYEDEDDHSRAQMTLKAAP